jgi:anti-sigma regulatory factor (Ser/Thr protein kinase)
VNRSTLDGRRPPDAFRHEALLYEGEADFIGRATSFLRDAVSAEEPTLVVVSAAKIDALRAELGRDAGMVQFADMAHVGANPARIIPAWREFVADHTAEEHPFRGIGEPIWAGRTAQQLVECERHESLLNLAFAGAPAWWLVCPYDTAVLEPAVIQEARRSHPTVLEGGVLQESAAYRDLDAVARPFDHPLPEPPGGVEEMAFGVGQLDLVRSWAAQGAAASGLDSGRTSDLVIAVNEVATNSLRHAGGRGTLRMWQEGSILVCEVRDAGRIDLPLAGRQRPAFDQEGGFGLWLVNQLCDLVQMRTFPNGSVVRLHMATA